MIFPGTWRLLFLLGRPLFGALLRGCLLRLFDLLDPFHCLVEIARWLGRFQLAALSFEFGKLRSGR